MDTEMIWMKYDNVDTNHVAERLFRGRVFQGSIVGIKLSDVTLGTMTIADILDNFPHIRSLTVHRGVSAETLGNLKYSDNIIALQIVDSLLADLEELPPHIGVLSLTLTRHHSSKSLVKRFGRLLKKHSGHVTVKINDYNLISDDNLMTEIGDLNVSISFYKT